MYAMLWPFTKNIISSGMYTICEEEEPNLDAWRSQSVTSTNCQYDISCQRKKKNYWKFIYMMTINVTHWDTSNDSFAFWYARGKILLSTIMAGFMCLHFSMQEEDVLEHSNANCHVCIHLSQTCRPLCKKTTCLITPLHILMPRYG